MPSKMAKQYDLRIAIHNHGPDDKKYPSPLDVWRMVRDRDARMGICMDVGHTVRIGEDPVAVIKQCAPRLYDFHMKDVSSATPSGAPVEVGKGVINIPGVLKTLLAVRFSYHVALEYEAQADNLMPGILGSYAYLRQELAAISIRALQSAQQARMAFEPGLRPGEVRHNRATSPRNASNDLFQRGAPVRERRCNPGRRPGSDQAPIQGNCPPRTGTPAGTPSRTLTRRAGN
jgi:hypothetical protein